MLLGAAGVLGGIPFFFVKAKESARTETLWPVGLVFVLLGVFCLAIHWLVSRGFKMVIDDEGLHSRALIGRFSVEWDKIERIQPARGALFITAPGGIRSAKGKVTRKKVIRYNTQGLKCGSLAFADYVIERSPLTRGTGQ